jgi:hypothetical protein
MWSMRSKSGSRRWEMRCYVCIPDHKTIFISANRTIIGTCKELNHWQTTNLLRLDVVEAIDLGAGCVISSWHPAWHLQASGTVPGAIRTRHRPAHRIPTAVEIPNTSKGPNQPSSQYYPSVLMVYDFIIVRETSHFACAFDLVEITPGDGAQG